MRSAVLLLVLAITSATGCRAAVVDPVMVDGFGKPAAVQWTSSNVGVATVTDSGVVTATGAGQATVVATSMSDPAKAAAAIITVR